MEKLSQTSWEKCSFFKHACWHNEKKVLSKRGHLGAKSGTLAPFVFLRHPLRITCHLTMLRGTHLRCVSTDEGLNLVIRWGRVATVGATAAPLGWEASRVRHVERLGYQVLLLLLEEYGGTRAGLDPHQFRTDKRWRYHSSAWTHLGPFPLLWAL